GCTTEASVLLDQPFALETVVETVSPDCISFLNGSIIIEDISGGVPGYEYSLNGQIFTPILNLPVEVPFLPSGSHQLIIRDGNGCSINESIVIQEPVQPFLSLGEDQEIALGDSVQL